MAQNIIHHKQYLKLQKLLRSPDNIPVVVSIVDQCDIEKSLIPILCLMTQCRNKMFAYGTELGKSENLVNYLKSVAEYEPEIDLNYIMKVYKLYREKYNMPEDPAINKFILNEYQTFEFNPLYAFKAQLDPKKKI